jgi:hypothetical protein
VTILAIQFTTLNTLQLATPPLIVNEGVNALWGPVAGHHVHRRRHAAVVRRAADSRRVLLPVLVAGMVFLITLLINIVRRIFDVPEDVAAILVAVKDLAPAAIPIALLIGFYRQSERRLQALVDAIPDRMLRYASDGRYLDPDPAEAIEPMIGPDALSARSLHARMLAAARAPALESAARALERGGLQAFDFSLEVPSGTREYEARIAPSGPDGSRPSTATSAAARCRAGARSRRGSWRPPMRNAASWNVTCDGAVAPRHCLCRGSCGGWVISPT